MACSSCDHKGFIETKIAVGGQWRPVIKQCQNCKDIEAYTKRIGNPQLAKLSAEVERIENGGFKDPKQPESGKIVTLADVLRHRKAQA